MFEKIKPTFCGTGCCEVSRSGGGNCTGTYLSSYC